jgi:ribonucleoside-triphosphate reductase
MSEQFDEIKGYLDGRSWRRKENSNFNFSYSGLLAHIANKKMADYSLEKNVGKEERDAHKNGDLHIHNLESGMLIPYCCGGSLLGLLQSGVKSAEISSKPAKHLDTVVDHITNYFYMNQLDFCGAQSLSDFDTLVAPFIRADNLSYDVVKQNIQRLVFGLNFTSRQAMQTPFTNLTFNMGCPKNLENTPVIVGGKLQDSTYNDYQDEIELINKAFAEVLLERDSCGNPFAFPIPTLNLTKRIDWDSDAMQMIMEENRHLGSYMFMNYCGSGISEDTIRAMCCRLQINTKELASARGSWNIGDGTGSIGVISLNMGRCGYLANKYEDLYGRIYKLIMYAKNVLTKKRVLIQKSLDNNFLPFAKFYGVNLDHYFSTIGVVGLNEMTLNYTGNVLSEEEKLVKDTLLYMRKILSEVQEETGCLWNLEMTPAEGCSYRLARNDREMFTDIKTLGTKNKPYYSAMLIPPSQEIGIFDKLRIEEQLLPLFSGGTICRTYLGCLPERESLVSFIKKIASTKIPYFDTTNVFSICDSDKKTFIGVHEKCPECGSSTSVFDRVVGYYRKSSKYNAGKKQEFEDRKRVTLPKN